MPPAYRALLHDSLADRAAENSGKAAVISGKGVLSYGELDHRSARLAQTLQQAGVRRGDRVAVFMDNTLEAATSVFGILRAGAAFVMVNPLTKAPKLRYIANDCRVRGLLTDAHLGSVVREAWEDIPSLRIVVQSGEALVAGHGSGPVRWMEFEDAVRTGERSGSPGTIPTDLAALIYTSGSTGNPKGVVHTHRSMVFARGSVSEYLGIQRDDVILNVLPLAFDYGLYQLLMAVGAGATLVLERSFAYPGKVFASMEKHGVTVFPGVPTVFSLLLAVTNTAAALPTEFFQGLREIFPNADLFPMYGLTECKRVSYLPPDRVDDKPGSVGIPIPGTEIFLRGSEGEPVAPGEAGILHVRGPHLMLGYWESPEQTQEMLVPGDIEGEVVLRTGDWFRMDADGYLYFLGRSDDIIKTRGEKVSPAEVEEALYAIPGVQEAAVRGVADPVLGEAIRAYVVVSPDSGLDERALRRGLSGRLESFMVPRELVFRDSLPKSPNGKILRRGLE
jgi:long-chain acyl-CoA synthetase